MVFFIHSWNYAMNNWSDKCNVRKFSNSSTSVFWNILHKNFLNKNEWKIWQIEHCAGGENEAKEKQPTEAAEVRKLLDIDENKGRQLYSKSCPNSLRNSLDSKAQYIYYDSMLLTESL